jgi:hypothetical protein
MAASLDHPRDLATGRESADWPHRLERGELLYFPQCPFDLPGSDDRAFLYRQQLRNTFHKNISYDPAADKVAGFRRKDREQETRLQRLLADLSSRAVAWLAGALPGYASWRLDRLSYRPEEEALRCLRITARNDLLHLDAFPARPTRGWRILRLFVNLNDQDPRVWATSDTFARLLERYGTAAGLPMMVKRDWRSFLRVFRPRGNDPTVFDRFMFRFQRFLRENDHFQEKGPKQYWKFAPGSAWLFFSDGLSYADIRGQYELDQVFLVPPDALVLPDQAPAALLERSCGISVLQHAA